MLYGLKKLLNFETGYMAGFTSFALQAVQSEKDGFGTFAHKQIGEVKKALD